MPSSPETAPPLARFSHASGTHPAARCALTLVLASALIAGCGSAPQRPAAAEPPALAPLLEQADAARKSGDMAKAMATLDDAARHHPASAEPWVRKAQMHFDQGSYATAVLAAQEGLQRNANDPAALSVIAVSGLRMAATSLSQMRRTSPVQGNTRTEAEALARTIREALGESSLLPPTGRFVRPGTFSPRRDPTPAAAEAAAPAANNAPSTVSGTPSGASAGSPSAASPTANAGTPRAPARAPSAAPARGGRNPLDILQ